MPKLRGLSWLSCGVFALSLSGCPNVAKDAEIDLSSVQLPPGFSISIYANNLLGARSLARGPAGTVFVGTRDYGVVYALTDSDGDGRADKTYTLINNLEAPNGVAVHDGALYVAEVRRILRFPEIETHLDNPMPVVINADFPTDGHHGWKYLRFGPDGKLYVPIGVPCDLCERDDPYGTMMRLNSDGSGLEVFARGLRNSVGFDFHPQTGELWFTENGADRLGNDEPPDELNAATGAGMHFGFPYCHGGDLEGGFGRVCAEFTPPRRKLGAHVAALGMTFYTGNMFPAEYRNRIFIAEHGSAHRGDYLGYRVMQVRLDGENAPTYEPFADGFLRDGESFARPVDVMVMPDGALLLSDDRSGTIYRITYRP